MNFHGDDLSPSSPEEGFFHVIPVPYEKSVSYGTGTVQGPRAILEASSQLELFDGKSIGAERGIYTSPFVECRGTDRQALAAITEAVGRTLALDKIPVLMGGEHTVTLGAVEALVQRHESFGVIQFDAHADLRDTYQDNPLSHACVMRRIHEMSIPIMQIGTRSYSREEHLLRQEKSIPYLDAESLFLQGVESFRLPDDFPEKIYITFDVDGLDPAVIPATGTPVPGGLSWYQALWILEKTMTERCCIGFDLVEFAPIASLPAYAFTAAQLVYNMMGILLRNTE